MTRTQAFGYYAQNFVALNERIAEPELIADPDLPRERLWQMRAREVVLATGAIERPLVFPDNDRPAVMLADSVRRYSNQYGAKVGDRIVVATAHDSAYRAALDLKKAGVGVELIVDLRREATGPMPDAARAAGIEVVTGAADSRRQWSTAGQRGADQASWRRANRSLRRAAHVGRMDALDAPVLAIARQACVRRSAATLQARSVSPTRAVGRRLQRDLRSCGRACGRRRSRARGGDGGWVRRVGSANLRRRRRSSSVRRRACPQARHSHRPSREGVRRFPERRLRQGRELGGPGGHALDRAHQALHHDRHGDRPGQAFEHKRARDRRRYAHEVDPRGGLNDLPPALYAGDLRRVRWPCTRRPVRSHPPHAHSRTGRPKTAPRSRMWAHGNAPGIFRNLAKQCTTQSRASAARPAPASDCSTALRWARSKSSAPTQRRFSSACTPTPSRSFRLDAAGTASC